MASLMLRAIPIPMASRPINCSASTLRSDFTPSSLPIVRVPVSATSSSPSYPTISCGRGDRKTARGKRFAHSFGNARPRNKKKGRGPPRVPAPPGPPRKDEFDQLEIVEEDEDFEEGVVGLLE